MLEVKDFDYNLPQELIAQEPLLDRASSRLLKLDKQTGQISHDHFYNIASYLRPGDCLVLNDTKVIPARLYGQKKDTGGSIEMLLLKRINTTDWEVALRPGKKAKPGAQFEFGNGELLAEIISVVDGGNRIVRFIFDGIFEEILDRLGQMPLPHYITHELKDKTRYQTVYAKHDGSAAAPTAGLHFTPELLDKIRQSGVDTAFVTLHVGLGTFRPVKAEKVEDHKMHSEFYVIDKTAADKINECKARGGRVIAVGTTSCRTLESAADENGFIKPCSADTSIFIYPGYRFRIIDGLITNFHLPKSTLVMLVSALCGRENLLCAYEEAIKERYRFYSFGDAMFIE